MKVLIDIGHPATIHLFKNLAKKLIKDKHQVLFTIREKDISLELINYYKLPYISFGKSYNGIFNKVLGIPVFCLKLIRVLRNFKPDLVLNSTTVYPPLVCKLFRVPLVSLHNTDADPFVKILSLFNPIFLTPLNFNKKLGKNHFRINSYNELAFLHPDCFSGDDLKIYEILKIPINTNYILLRFVSSDASDDLSVSGLNNDEKIKVVHRLSKYGKVFISSEIDLPNELDSMHLEKKYNTSGYMQSIENKAILFFGESGAMAAESSLLGTPSIYVSNKRLSFLDEIEHNYQLVFTISDYKLALKKAEEILSDSRSKDIWTKNRKIMLNDKINLNKFLIWFIYDFPRSLNKLKADLNYQNKFISNLDK